MKANRTVFLRRALMSLLAVCVLSPFSSAMAQESDQEIMVKGVELHTAKKYDEALKWHKKLSESSGPLAMVGHYNMGCAYSIKNDADKAFECLNKSVDAGLLDVNQFQNDDDLANIKEDPRFEKLIARVKNGGKPVEEKKMKAPSIAGSWMIKSGTRSGAEVPQERLTTISITDKEVTIPAGPSTFVMSYKLDTSQSPFQIDMKIESGPVPEGMAKGIVKMEGEKMMLCYNGMGGDRPADFKTVEGDNCFYFEMVKEAPKKMTATSLVGAWTIVEGTRGGEQVAADRMSGDIVFTKDGISMGEGEQAFKMSYVLNLEKSPVEVDMKITDGPAPAGSPATGIVKMDADGHLLLCYEGMGGARPDAFKSTEDNNWFLFKMKKKK